jgi:hypothetical protein
MAEDSFLGEERTFTKRPDGLVSVAEIYIVAGPPTRAGYGLSEEILDRLPADILLSLAEVAEKLSSDLRRRTMGRPVDA